jgi:signal transduction histidine kinase/CHASE1-domain containing sensor protein/CheY-like chemotaxis protein
MRNRVFLPYLILLLGFCFTLIVYYYFSKLTYEQDQLRFESSVQEIRDQVRLRIATSTALLRAGTGLFAASDSVDAQEFEKFVTQIELEKNYPGVEGIGYSARFAAEDKDKTIAGMKRQGFTNFKIWPDDDPRSEYNAIIYLQPFSTRNKGAIGYDMGTNETRREAMEAARDSGKPFASGRVSLVQEKDIPEVNKQSGFLIYVPVYRKNAPINDEQQRRDALLGFVYSPLRAEDFLEAVTASKKYDVNFQVYDGTEEKPDKLLGVVGDEVSANPTFTDAKQQEVEGRKWTIRFVTNPAFETHSNRYLLKYTLILGGLLSLLFAAVTRAEIRARSRAEHAAEELKKSETTIRNTLQQREHTEEELRKTSEALREADQRALLEYERLLERIKVFAQALGTARELHAIFSALREFTNVSVPCNGFFVSLYDPARDVRTAMYGWADGEELDVSELPPQPVTASGPNSRAVRTGQVIITNDYMRNQQGGVIVGPDNGLRPDSSLAVPMAVMGRIIGTIEVQSYDKNVYRPEHATAMSMAANLTAVAIENVRLLELERTARQAAEESNRLKDEFLATVSHELRTPLTAILGWSRLLEGGTLDDSVTQQAVEVIGRNAKAQAQIVDDILDVSRIITGNLYLDLHPLEVVPVVENAINVVRPTADAKGIRIEKYFDSTPAMISGDANRLQQVVWNLLSNAVKFTDSGGRVCVKVSRVGGAVEIKVSDTGQGISKEFLPYVFDRFRQADSTTTRQHGGLGLGLAIARHLVEIHGGTINAESAGTGRGATFTIRLPLIEATANARSFAEVDRHKLVRSQQLLSGLNVLLVDDDSDTLTLMATALKRRQANVTAVSSAGEAIQAITRKRPDVLVSDIAMPDEDGYGLIKKIRSLEKGVSENIPAVAITAYAKEEDRERALSAGFQIYLAKPVELTELISVVARAAKRDF